MSETIEGKSTPIPIEPMDPRVAALLQSETVGNGKEYSQEELHAKDIMGKHIIKSQAEEDIELVKHLNVLRVEPGDALVLRSEKPLASNQFISIGEKMERLFPDNRFILLDCGMELGVIRGAKE